MTYLFKNNSTEKKINPIQIKKKHTQIKINPPHPNQINPKINQIFFFSFYKIESFNVIHLIINDSKKLRIFSSLEVCGKNDDFFPLDFIFLFSVEEMNLYDF